MSIVDKLKLYQYKNLAVMNQPADYHLFTEQSTDLKSNHDAIFIFVENIEEMAAHTERIINEQSLANKGYLFLAYPKKGNKRYDTFIHRDEIFPALNIRKDYYLGDSDIKFSRLVSMDDVFTVIGFKREKKRAHKTSAPSQKAADYEKHVPDVKRWLADHPQELDFYNELTPGYQKEWARHIYSAKQEKTRVKRFHQMVEVLSQGYKTLDLYRQHKK
ncbi:YdeI/OmpD-associated family protein [Halobacillus sp. A1]|uniref:YdeI/OmpD-associated family protein n=1 Tax=Halobacillus sp. A1 TaxID=2880262 RepID=UPI0020A644AF|nr:YdeI/OmpD-associated family protein [Halobacillus sp. A1]MCP3033072.1 YdeI/OmpD-associated family protein [Halobacillus sp. A1]